MRDDPVDAALSGLLQDALRISGSRRQALREQLEMRRSQETYGWAAFAAAMGSLHGRLRPAMHWLSWSQRLPLPVQTGAK